TTPSRRPPRRYFLEQSRTPPALSFPTLSSCFARPPTVPRSERKPTLPAAFTSKKYPWDPIPSLSPLLRSKTPLSPSLSRENACRLCASHLLSLRNPKPSRLARPIVLSRSPPKRRKIKAPTLSNGPPSIAFPFLIRTTSPHSPASWTTTQSPPTASLWSSTASRPTGLVSHLPPSRK